MLKFENSFRVEERFGRTIEIADGAAQEHRQAPPGPRGHVGEIALEVAHHRVHAQAGVLAQQPRGAVEHFRLRAHRAMAWMDAFIFFRERFPAAAQRQPPESLYNLPQLLSSHGDELDAATDLLVRECVLPEIEEILA